MSTGGSSVEEESEDEVSRFMNKCDRLNCELESDESRDILPELSRLDLSFLSDVKDEDDVRGVTVIYHMLLAEAKHRAASLATVSPRLPEMSLSPTLSLEYSPHSRHRTPSPERSPLPSNSIPSPASPPSPSHSIPSPGSPPLLSHSTPSPENSPAPCTHHCSSVTVTAAPCSLIHITDIAYLVILGLIVALIYAYFQPFRRQIVY